VTEVNALDAARELKKKLKTAGKGKLVAVEGNLVDSVWGKSRPSRPEHPVFVLPDKFTGTSLLASPVDDRQTIPGEIDRIAEGVGREEGFGYGGEYVG
jgi:hypothetical protein